MGRLRFKCIVINILDESVMTINARLDQRFYIDYHNRGVFEILNVISQKREYSMIAFIFNY